VGGEASHISLSILVGYKYTMRKNIFVNNQYYHIYNRGVDKRKIFLDRNDYIRFLHDLYEFNDKNPAIEYSRLPKKIKDVGGEASHIMQKRKKLVEIICFCQMPNHYHLILKQLVEKGISRFMHKLGTGYTMSFNLKQKRNGILFQGPFKAIHIENETYLIHLSRYIHLNPVKLIKPEWKKEDIKNWKKINKFLENYKWSSYSDYIGKKNFPSIINKELLLNIFDNEKKYKKFIKEWQTKDIESMWEASPPTF